MKYAMGSKSLSDMETIIALIFGGQDYKENTHLTICETNLMVNYLKEAGITGNIEYQNAGANVIIRAFK